MEKSRGTKNLKESFSVWKEVFSKPKYIMITLAIAFTFYLLNVLLINYQNIVSLYSLLGLSGVLSLMPNFFLGFKNLIPTSSFITLIFLAFLIGALFSLIAYRTKMVHSAYGKRGFISSGGIFLGVLAPGCAACGLGLLPLIGISATALTFLPYDGLELSILAIGIISFSVIKITKDINKGISCEIPIKK